MLSLFFSLFFIVDQILMVGGFVWLIIDGAWAALGMGIAAACGIALGLALALTITSLLGVAGAIQVEKRRTVAGYCIVALYTVSSALVITYTFVFVSDYFEQFSDRAHPVALSLWSYAVNSAALSWIISSERTRISKAVGAGILGLSAKISFISYSAIYLFIEDKFLAISVALVLNLLGLGFASMSNSMTARANETSL